MLNKWILSIIVTLFLSTGLAFAGDKVNINTASLEQLQTINGVGVSTAEAIITYREESGLFKNVDDLLNVKGIGEKKLEKFSEQISVVVPE
ncbi:MAG: helix-hairpin-helix domain-containing protein [Methylophaga sp.]|nr:helix-hairpin-helix domain-containing protein [Methylophaga sp.]